MICVANKKGCKGTSQNPITIEFYRVNIREAIIQIAASGKLNVVIGPEVTGEVSITQTEVSCRDALETTVGSLGFVVVEDSGGILMITPSNTVLEANAEHLV